MLNKQLTTEALRYKNLPFECNNCGNKPTTKEVIKHNGSCEFCGDSIIAYVIETAEMIEKLQVGK